MKQSGIFERFYFMDNISVMFDEVVGNSQGGSNGLVVNNFNFRLSEGCDSSYSGSFYVEFNEFIIKVFYDFIGGEMYRGGNIG